MKGNGRKTGLTAVLWLLVCCLVLSAPLSVCAAKRLSPQEDFTPGQASLSELRAFFQNGGYWNHLSGTANSPYSVTDTPCAVGYDEEGLHADEGVVCNSFGIPGVVYTGWQCCGFIRLLTYLYFGVSCDNWEQSTSLSDLKAGDVLYLSNGGPHYIWLLSVTDNGNGTAKVTYTDCNGAGRQFHCQIQWDARCTVNKADSEVELGVIGSWDVVKRYVSPGTARETLSERFAAKEPVWTVVYADGQGKTTEKKTVTADVTLSACAFSKTGYTFAGWTVSRSSDKAVWTRKGWSQMASEAAVLAAGKTVPLSALKRDDDEQYTVTATWKRNALTVTYYTGGGTVTGGKLTAQEGKIVNADTKKAVTAVWTYGGDHPAALSDAATLGLSRPGYRFVGWALRPCNHNTVTAADLEVRVKNKTGEQNLYAIWVPNIADVWYNTNGGTVTGGEYEALRNGRICLSENRDRVLSRIVVGHSTTADLLPARVLGLSREGYVFAGWSLTAGGAVASTEELRAAVTEHRMTQVLYAVWTAESS